MDRRVVLGSIAALAVGAAAGFLLLRDSDEAQIRAALDRLARACRIAKDDSPLGRAARIRGVFDELLVPDVAVDIAELQGAKSGRGELVRLAVAAQGVWSSLEIDLSGVRVVVDPGATSASVDATAKLRGARAGAAEQADVRKVALRMRNDGGWKVAAVTVYPRGD